VLLPLAYPGAAQAATLRQPVLGYRKERAVHFSLGEYQISATRSVSFSS
jgi:hypothetical protein